MGRKRNWGKMSFTIATNNIKHLAVTLTKQVKDMYDNKVKSLQNKIEEDIIKWKDSPWTVRSNIIETVKSFYQKQSTDSMQFPSNSQHNSL